MADIETKKSKTTANVRPQQEEKHPEEWKEDLSPGRMAGQNIGTESVQPERENPTAYDIKHIHRSLGDFTDDALKQIPVLPEGTRLRQGATYLNLRDEKPKEFTATGEMVAGKDDAYVPKDNTPYILWNRLLGEEKPAEGVKGPSQ